MSEEYKELIESSHYFCALQTKIMKVKKDQIAKLLQDNIKQICEKWNKFLALAFNHISCILKLYEDLYNNETNKIVNNYNGKNKTNADTKDIDKVLTEMSSYYILVYIISKELDFLSVGLFPRDDSTGHISDIFINSIDITLQNIEINRSTKLHDSYQFAQKYISKLERMHQTNDQLKFSCLSLDGLEYIFYQLYCVLDWANIEYDKTSLKNPIYYNRDQHERIYHNISLFKTKIKKFLKNDSSRENAFHKNLFMKRIDQSNGDIAISFLNVSILFYYLYLLF
jgi:hypothetical protein